MDELSPIPHSSSEQSIPQRTAIHPGGPANMNGRVAFHEQWKSLTGSRLIQPGDCADLRRVFQALVCTFFYFADSLRIHMYVKSTDPGIAGLGLPFSFKLID
ncbi:hypothetical protein D3C87_1787890 [compost metagenome]